jgi:hypothetical protein
LGGALSEASSPTCRRHFLDCGRERLCACVCVHSVSVYTVPVRVSVYTVYTVYTMYTVYTVGMPLYKSLGEATSPPLVFQKKKLFLNFVP